MTADTAVLQGVLLQALSGRGAHVRVAAACEGLAWKQAGLRPDGAPHSIFQIVNHMVYWQDFSLRWLAGDKPPSPRHAAQSWPGKAKPSGAEDWDRTLEQLRRGLAELDRWAAEEEPFSDRGSGKTTLEILQMIATHNSYHVGQVATLRQLLEAWPPPGGGATW
jgi:uncharacterized damage-inducible protein DinB